MKILLFLFVQLVIYMVNIDSWLFDVLVSTSYDWVIGISPVLVCTIGNLL